MRSAFAVGAILALALTSDVVHARSSCDAGVTKAVATKVSCKLKVIALAQQTGTTPNQAKIANCETRFASKCGKAQSKGDCAAQSGSCAALETKADAAVDELAGTPPTTTNTTTTTSTTVASGCSGDVFFEPCSGCGRTGQCLAVCNTGCSVVGCVMTNGGAVCTDDSACAPGSVCVGIGCASLPQGQFCGFSPTTPGVCATLVCP